MTNDSINDGPAPARSAVPDSGGADGREDTGADDCSNPDERYAECGKCAFQSKLWTANAGQNFVKVLGAKNSSKQGVASGIGFR